MPELSTTAFSQHFSSKVVIFGLVKPFDLRSFLKLLAISTISQKITLNSVIYLSKLNQTHPR